MPANWLVIFVNLPRDLTEVWSFLLERRIPPLNPLHYGSLLMFMLTLIPCQSLTVRRLHDSGKSAKWVKLRFVATTSGVMLVIGMSTEFTTSDVGGNGSSTLSNALLMAVIGGHGQSMERYL